MCLFIVKHTTYITLSHTHTLTHTHTQTHTHGTNIYSIFYKWKRLTNKENTQYFMILFHKSTFEAANIQIYIYTKIIISKILHREWKALMVAPVT